MAKILIIDDEEGMRFVLSNILKKDGYEVVTAEDGRQALQVLEEHRPDMAFLDLHLPDMDGTEVLREIKKVRKDIPVVMCSGFGDVDFAVKTMKYGAMDYVSKPFKNEDVLNMAKKALASKNISTAAEENSQPAAAQEVQPVQESKPEPVKQKAKSKQKNNIMIPMVAAAVVLSVVLGVLIFSAGRKGNKKYSFPITYSNPTALAFDGEHLWVSDWFGQTIYKHTVGEELSIAKYYSFSEIHPAGIAWGADCIWAVDSWTAEINCLNLDSTLSVRNMFAYPGTEPSGMFFDGTVLWVCDVEEDMIYRLMPQDEELVVVDKYKSKGPNPVGIFWDMQNIWTVDGDLKRIYKHSMDTDLTVVDEYKFPVEKITGKISGVGWDGSDIWIALDKKSELVRVSFKELEKI
jgi:CheY-like chemotaxis protein